MKVRAAISPTKVKDSIGWRPSRQSWVDFSEILVCVDKTNIWVAISQIIFKGRALIGDDEELEGESGVCGKKRREKRGHPRKVTKLFNVLWLSWRSFSSDICVQMLTSPKPPGFRPDADWFYWVLESSSNARCLKYRLQKRETPSLSFSFFPNFFLSTFLLQRPRCIPLSGPSFYWLLSHFFFKSRVNL